MDDENFMESFKSKDVLYYLNNHIRDLADLKRNLNETTFQNLEKIWERYAYEGKLGRDEYLLYELQKFR